MIRKIFLRISYASTLQNKGWQGYLEVTELALKKSLVQTRLDWSESLRLSTQIKQCNHIYHHIQIVLKRANHWIWQINSSQPLLQRYTLYSAVSKLPTKGSWMMKFLKTSCRQCILKKSRPVYQRFRYFCYELVQ